MKSLLDEQLSPRIAEDLRSRGLDAESVKARSDLRESPDEEVLELAAREDRAVVTNNVKDFRPLAARRLEAGVGHGGLILLPPRRSRSRDAIGKLADAIETIMRDNPGGIADSERWLPV